MYKERKMDDHRSFSNEDLKGLLDIKPNTESSLMESFSFHFDEEEAVLYKSSSKNNSKDLSSREIIKERAKKREMNSSQEIWNALTMLVAPTICLYFIFSGAWYRHESFSEEELDWSVNDLDEDCIEFPKMHVMTPDTTKMIAIGYLMHSPISILYHLLCAFKLPPGAKRLDHWSRRLDQTMIHVMSAFICYGTSGSMRYFILAMVFAIDSGYRLFQPLYRPTGCLVRMTICFLLPVLPAFAFGYYVEAMKCLIIYGFTGWIFINYPFGGYSHGIFHLVAALSTPVQLHLSTKTVVGKIALVTAAKCSLMSHHG